MNQSDHTHEEIEEIEKAIEEQRRKIKEEAQKTAEESVPYVEFVTMFLKKERLCITKCGNCGQTVQELRDGTYIIYPPNAGNDPKTDPYAILPNGKKIVGRLSDLL